MHAESNRRFIGRPLAPADPSEIRRIERWLATARVFLAASALAAIYMDPTQLGNSPAAYGLLGFYMGNSILVLMLVRRRKASTASFRLLVHAADIVWPAFISVFAEGPRSPFFLFFFFVLTAAAYRWGLWETLSTAAAEVVLLWAESFLLLHVWAGRAGGLPWHALSGLQVNVTEFEPKRLFMLSVYLLVMGLLLGYLAEQQKHLRAEKAVVTRMLSKVRVDAGLTGTLQQISREIVSMYGADRLLVASQEIHSHRTFLGELHNEDETSDFVWLDSSPRESKIYLEDFPGEAFYARSEGDRWSVVAVDREGNQLPSPSTEALVRLKQRQSFGSAVAVSFVFGGEWRGRVLVFDPVVAWRHAGAAALSARFVPASWAGGLQRLPAAPAEAPCQCGGTRALRPGTARWRGAVADRGGDAGGCAPAPGGNDAGCGRWRAGPDSRFVAGRSSQAARIDAANEVDRRRCPKIPSPGDRHGGAV